ncbi:MHYT domain-containing protein [uncultured Ruegeria sp.]|uniref:MHYT domain-containing protein n=1 Tax=uncultured Ruegeria sp. TaxID=259304 RepID=UPI00263434E7|nr:MHYT domain-containing protein [uncultured Ruegeria sp.]
MEHLDFGHNGLLVAMSFIVALVAGFTGLSLTKNLSSKSLSQRKVSVALASVALGGGIWSMHFVAMLGLQLPILFYYDAAITLASALIAILMVAVALGLLHLAERTPRIITVAGVIVGAGILVMHYVGMAGLQLCRAVYSPLGVALSSICAVALCVLAFRVAYSTRNNRNIIIGTLCFGAAVFAVHFLAMAGTSFVVVDRINEFGPTISNETMAIGVILSSFAIFSTFLWVSSAFLSPEPDRDGDISSEATLPDVSAESPNDVLISIPCESDGNRILVRVDDIAFVRADGHYTQVYTDTDRRFCVWPITEAVKRLEPAGFMQVHRSYLINPSKVARFERNKDKGKCTFFAEGLPPAPVSRSKMKDIELRLAPLIDATGAA